MYGVKALSNDFSTELRIDPKQQYPRVIAPLHLKVVDFTIFANVASPRERAIYQRVKRLEQLQLSSNSISFTVDQESAVGCIFHRLPLLQYLFRKKNNSEELSLRLSMGGLILYISVHSVLIQVLSSSFVRLPCHIKLKFN